jgi:hypothetical protein
MAGEGEPQAHATEHPADNNTRRAETGIPKTSVVPKSPDSVPTNETTDEKTKRRDKRENIRFWVEIIALPFLILYTLFAGYQSCANEKAAEAARDSADRAYAQLLLTRSQLESSNKDFGDTLTQMRAQTAAQQQAAGAQVRAAQAMADQVKKLQAGVAEQQAANNLARQSLEAQTRPWVEIEGEPRNVEVGSISIRFALKLRNYGQSPARGIPYRQQFWLIMPGGGPEPVLFDMYRVCQQSDEDMSNLFQVTGLMKTILPGPEGITQDAIGEVPRTPFIHREPPPTLLDYNMLIGCVAYRGPHGETYHTRVIYGVHIAEIPPHDENAKRIGTVGPLIWCDSE